MDTKFFLFELGLNLIYLYQIYTMKPSEFEIFYSVKSYDKKLSKIAEISMILKSA